MRILHFFLTFENHEAFLLVVATKVIHFGRNRRRRNLFCEYSNLCGVSTESGVPQSDNLISKDSGIYFIVHAA